MKLNEAAQSFAQQVADSINNPAPTYTETCLKNASTMRGIAANELAIEEGREPPHPELLHMSSR